MYECNEGVTAIK